MNSVLVPIQLFCMFRLVILLASIFQFRGTLNAFEKAYNRYKQEMKPLYHKQWGTQT